MKRVFDFSVALVVFIGLLPMMMLIALGVVCTSCGPALFTQERVGLNGRRFRLYKFRTMEYRPDESGTSVTTSADRRITPFGRWLRRLKLDELPQLFNVVVGDMSFVGPRPDVPEIVANYTPEMRTVLSVPPGLTSYATLHFRDEERLLAGVSDPESFYREQVVPLKVSLAMEHVRRRSFGFDLWVLLATCWMLSLGRWIFPVAAPPAVMNLRRKLEVKS
jgi:lipopolysaccharide/colanic/teichoic acid biosynthesis glycosyltransferase